MNRFKPILPILFLLTTQVSFSSGSNDSNPSLMSACEHGHQGAFTTYQFIYSGVCPAYVEADNEVTNSVYIHSGAGVHPIFLPNAASGHSKDQGNQQFHQDIGSEDCVIRKVDYYF